MQFMVHSQHKSAFCWAELELGAPGGASPLYHIYGIYQ